MSARPRARTSLPLLFRPAFCPRVSLCAREWASLTSSAAPYSSNSYPWIENPTCIRYPTMEISFGREKEWLLFFILKMYKIVQSLKKLHMWLFKFMSWVICNREVRGWCYIPLLTFLKVNLLKTFIFFDRLPLKYHSRSEQWSFFLLWTT